MAEQSTNNGIERVSTDWDYLKKITEAYGGLMNSSTYYCKLKLESDKRIRTNHPRVVLQTKLDFCAKLYGFYIMCSPEFGKYLANGFEVDFGDKLSKTITQNSYSTLFAIIPTDDKLFKMLEVISYWQQTYGAFRTKTMMIDPHRAIQGRGA